MLFTYLVHDSGAISIGVSEDNLSGDNGMAFGLGKESLEAFCGNSRKVLLDRDQLIIRMQLSRR